MIIDHVFNKTKEVQVDKFNWLKHKKSVKESNVVPSQEIVKKTVINLSSRVLTHQEECLLSRGLGFAVVPTLNKLDLISSV